MTARAGPLGPGPGGTGHLLAVLTSVLSRHERGTPAATPRLRLRNQMDPTRTGVTMASKMIAFD
ncbi:hypothetical protein, partial [Nonomuraea composti]|uniref:hypothetical protein n=1 Tax=Nonomuraea composti TaxID=2720023 RepID=UPI00197E294A